MGRPTGMARPGSPTLRNPTNPLPASSAVIPGQQGTPTAFAPTRAVILVVEDEAMLALDLEQVLTDAGYEVVLAGDGPTALARAADPSLCVRAAVVDLHLPGSIDGSEVIRCLRTQSSGLPV